MLAPRAEGTRRRSMRRPAARPHPFLAKCGEPCRGCGEPLGRRCILGSPRAAVASPAQSLSSRSRLRSKAPQEGLDSLCPPNSISSGTTSATSFGARLPTSSSTSGSSRSSWPACDGKTLYVRAPGAHPHLGRRALPAAAAPRRRARFDAPRGGRGRRARLGGARRRRAPAGRTPPTTAPRRAAEPQVQLRPVRDRRGQPLRPRRLAGRRRAAGAGVQPALPARPARASARPTCCTRSATTSSATARGCASATPRSRSSPPASSTRCAATAPATSRTTSAAPTSS